MGKYKFRFFDLSGNIIESTFYGSKDEAVDECQDRVRREYFAQGSVYEVDTDEVIAEFDNYD